VPVFAIITSFLNHSYVHLACMISACFPWMDDHEMYYIVTLFGLLVRNQSFNNTHIW